MSTRHEILRSKAILILLVLIVYIFLVLPAATQELKTIQITDQMGIKEKLSNPSFSYSPSRSYLHEYIEILLSESPNKSFWIHHSQIEIAVFEVKEERLKIMVTLDNGEVLEGIFPDNKLKIKGEGDLGEAEYNIDKIKSIELLEFSSSQNDIINRDIASEIYKKNRKVSRSWTVIDGKATFNAMGFAFRDSYSQGLGYYERVHLGYYREASYRKGDISKTVMVQRGSSIVNLDLDVFESMEITGRKIDDNPEMIIVKKDGSKFTVALKLEGLDVDDYLIWQKPYGWEGISILPLRKISLFPGNK